MKSVEKEFLKVITQYQGIIHKVNFMYFRTKEDKDDNFQEIVYHLWRSFHSLKDKCKIGSWIYTVAINVSISKIRKKCSGTENGDLHKMSVKPNKILFFGFIFILLCCQIDIYFSLAFFLVL